jgi:general secretion pathway protein L
MPGKILGLDISEDSITAVQVKSELKGYRITACARVMIEKKGGLDDALKVLFDQMDLKSDTYLTSIPGEHVSYRNLQMPFKEPRKIRQTIAFELESMLPFPIEDLIVDFTIIDQSDQSEILAASVSRRYISEYLAPIQSHGIDPDVLDIRSVPMVLWLLKQAGIPDDGLLLEIGLKRNTMVLYLKKRIVLIRTFAFDCGAIAQSFSDGTNNDLSGIPIAEEIESCFRSFCTMVHNTLHAFEWQTKRLVRPEKLFFTGIGALYPETGDLLNRFLDIPVEQINLSGDKRVRMDKVVAQVWNPALMDNALAFALRDNKQGQGFNFRKDEFEVKRHYMGLKKEIRKVAVFFILILSFLAADFYVDYYFLKKRYKMADQKIIEVFKQTFPDVKRIVDPLQQMRVKIKEIKRSAISLPGINAEQKSLDLIRDISHRIPKSLDVHMTRMVVDPETVRISGKTDTFNTVDNIKNRLEPSAYFNAVTISSANLDREGKRVQFEIKLQRAK